MEDKLSEKQFCEHHSNFHGEHIDKVKQIVQQTFTGDELYDFAYYIDRQSKQKLLPLLAAKDLEIERLLKEEKKLVEMYSELGIDLTNADKEITQLKAEIEKYHNGTIIEKK